MSHQQKIQKRIQLHALGKEHMKKSEWREAQALFLQARTECGDNILLLIDLAASEYMLGHLFSWKKRLTEIEVALADHRLILSTLSLYNAFLFLGKYLEEQGLFKAALQSYRAVIEGEEFSDRQKIMCLAAIVRVQCFLGSEREVESDYVDLSSRVRAFETENQRIEVLHALMLAEVSLNGLDAAMARYHSARQNVEYRCDFPLLYFDLIEAVLMNCPEDVERLRNGFVDSEIASENGFEESLQKILEKQPVSYQTAFAHAENMTATTQFRLANLILRYGESAVDQARAKKLVSILLRSFDSFSAKALTENSRLSVETEAEIQIDSRSSTLRIGAESLNWSRRKTAFTLLAELSQHSDVEVEAVVQKVWDAELNASYSERLRLLIRRINEDLQTITLRPEVLVLNSGRVSLASGIVLKSVEDT